jgi:chromosome segregation ATPase
MPEQDSIDRTHYDGCEQWHIACAQKRMADLEAKLAERETECQALAQHVRELQDLLAAVEAERDAADEECRSMQDRLNRLIEGNKAALRQVEELKAELEQERRVVASMEAIKHERDTLKTEVERLPKPKTEE